MSGNDPVDLLSTAQIGAALDLWRRDRREIVASFGGISMLPTIPPGTPLRISCGAAATAGDVILFEHRGEIALHRLLMQRGKWMLTRGDANAIPDQPVRGNALIGRVREFNRDAAWLEIPRWFESDEQRRMLRLIGTLFTMHPSLARPAVTLLWQFRRLIDAWRRVGLLGTATRIWSKTGGYFLDIDLISTMTIATTNAFEPVSGFRAERVDAGTPLFAGAARLLGVDPRKRGDQDAYVWIAPDGSVAACSFSDRSIVDGVAHQRGVAVDARFRGQGLGSSVLRFQARELAAAGAREVEYHVGATNRASRQLFVSLGARRRERWIIVKVLRRFQFARRRAAEPSTPPTPN